MVIPGPNIFAKSWEQWRTDYIDVNAFTGDPPFSDPFRFDINQLMDEGRAIINRAERTVSMHPSMYLKYTQAFIDRKKVVPSELEMATVLVFAALAMKAGAEVLIGMTSKPETTNAPKKSSYTETIH